MNKQINLKEDNESYPFFYYITLKTINNMVSVIFYGFSDEPTYRNELSVKIAERFNVDYPDTEVKINYDDEEEEYRIIFDLEGDDIDAPDTFLCEEICKEHEVYCEILNLDNYDSKSYYYDEEDKWFYQ